MDESTNKNRKDEPFVVINKKGLNIHPKLDRVFRFLQDVEQKRLARLRYFKIVIVLDVSLLYFSLI